MISTNCKATNYWYSMADWRSQEFYPVFAKNTNICVKLDFSV
jgi:hypothetical protein